LNQLLQDVVLAANKTERERQRDGNGNYIAATPQLSVNTEPFFAAAWDLVRHGILAPVPAPRPDFQIDYHDDFLVTARGVKWLADSGDEVVLPLELQRFADALKRHSSHFGRTYLQRALEALNCYHAHCYYATCVMAGAAAEAVLIALAVEKKGERTWVEKRMRGTGGRQELHKALRPEGGAEGQRRVETLIDLVSYYRDDAAHTLGDPITDEGAQLTLLLLLNVAAYADQHWAYLTAAPTPPPAAAPEASASPT
jgi:hypothetical protein